MPLLTLYSHARGAFGVYSQVYRAWVLILHISIMVFCVVVREGRWFGSRRVAFELSRTDQPFDHVLSFVYCHLDSIKPSQPVTRSNHSKSNEPSVA